MDEMPITAGRQSMGEIRKGYVWPMYGEDDEIVFHCAPSREHHHVQAFLGEFRGTLLSDGYEACAAYANHNEGVRHADCLSKYCRRGFERTQDIEPAASAEALALTGALYRHEQIIRNEGLAGESKLTYRSKHSEPIVEAFWSWCDVQCHRPDLLSSNPLTKVINYVKARQASQQVFLSDPNVPIDTNHTERGLRPIPLGKKNW